ncbi:probable cytochrome P450 6a23 [Tribolium madens]|uniref:probable cytochrome P450 6a23 n=1 Tax=Tribolium madens TaxID=41895 RepID=UPI001CF72B82|nr:probable cytochrome P450 6a23 [Tribolium madens]XP_044255036.1 probable cytochrome P450 6a23 [Tribolium madens]
MTLLSTSVMYDVVAIFTTLTIGVILFFNWKYKYWVNVGLPIFQPTFLLGNTKEVMLGRLTFGEQFQIFYNKFKANGFKHGGVYLCLQQFYIPVDPGIIKCIMQSDFHHFMNHGNYVDEDSDPLNGHLFNLEDAKWKNMRVKLTPTFTSGKMKMMFQTLVDCTTSLKDIIDETAKNHTPIEIKDILARFTTDIIGSVAFGLNCNSLKNPDDLFRKYGKRIFEVEVIERIKFLMMLLFPEKLLRKFKLRVTKQEVEDFFMKVIRDTVDYREKNNIYRKDFLHLLIQLKNRGTVSDDSSLTNDQQKTDEKGLTMNELAAQAFVFFLAGFETSSTTMTFALYEIANNPHIQEKLREEVNTVLKKHNDELTYDAMMEMTYMEKNIYETLRKYPPLPVLTRKCNKDYTIPNTSIQLKKGDMVGISALGLHKDPDYYPDPEKFDPERFSEENKSKRPDFTWIPFGEGPRLCIGMRFGLLQTKVGLTTILKNYKIKLNSKTKVPLIMDKKSFISSAEGGVWLDVDKLN